MKFQIFKEGKIVDKFGLCGAYLFGTDTLVVRKAKITFEGNVVNCLRQNDETAGLALLWPIDDFGSVILPTTCLPERDAPYNLNLEIARAKLMQIINKREDWAFFNVSDQDGNILEQAQHLFIKAIQNIADPILASKLADESLKKAVVFSEKMAIIHAEQLFKTRGDKHGFGRGCLRCRISPAQLKAPKYVENLLKLFNFVTIPVNWAEIETSRGSYDFSKIDSYVGLLSKKRLLIGAGPLLRFSDEYLPKWLTESNYSFEKILDASYRFVSSIVSRYSDTIRTWCVISGINVFNHFNFSLEQVIEMTRAVNMAAKSANERAQKIVEICNPWGEYYATSANTMPPLVYADVVVQSGINFDAFALPFRFGKNDGGMHIRDMMHISALLDNFTALTKPLHITDVQVPSRPGDGLFNKEVAGKWHSDWDEDIQGQWIEQFYKIALGKHSVDSVSYSNLTDVKNSIVPDSGLMTSQFKPKKSFHTLKKIQEVIFSR